MIIPRKFALIVLLYIFIRIKPTTRRVHKYNRTYTPVTPLQQDMYFCVTGYKYVTEHA